MNGKGAESSATPLEARHEANTLGVNVVKTLDLSLACRLSLFYLLFIPYVIPFAPCSIQ